MWETTNIRPQQGDRIIAIADEKTAIGVILIEPITVTHNLNVWQSTVALIIQDDESETPLDTFNLWTPYPEGGSRE